MYISRSSININVMIYYSNLDSRNNNNNSKDVNDSNDMYTFVIINVRLNKHDSNNI